MYVDDIGSMYRWIFCVQLANVAIVQGYPSVRESLVDNRLSLNNCTIFDPLLNVDFCTVIMSSEVTF